MKHGADWNPIAELIGVQKRMNQLFESALARSDLAASEGLGYWTPLCDVYAAAEHLVVCVELPGVEAGQIDVRLEEDDLVVEGTREMEREREGEQYHRVERSYGRFSRRVRLPSRVDRSAVRATFTDGVLRIVLPARNGQASGPLRVSID
jgi:HSP20 family protein